MELVLPYFRLFFLLLLVAASLAEGAVHYYDFLVKEINVTMLCQESQVMTVNGQFPGPEIRARKGDTVYVNTYNHGLYGVTLHWHGVKNPGNPWSDGPEYVTQCALNPGQNFTYKLILSDEEGTVWWHAHSDWTRATVHGAIIILPEEGTTFPFPEPDGEEVIVLGSWYSGDLKAEVDYALENAGAVPKTSGYTINGQLGDFSDCATNETIYYWTVDYGKTYLVRIINAVVDDEVFFAIAGHNMTIVGMDGAYVKPFTTDHIMISPGNTIDVLVTTNQSTDYRYYMATRQYSSEHEGLTNSAGTAILQYSDATYDKESSPIFPTDTLPYYVDRIAAMSFTDRLRSLASEDHPISVPMDVTRKMFIVISMNKFECPSGVNCTTDDPDYNGTTLGSTMNNISWWAGHEIDILQAYYRNISGVYTTDFPDQPSTWYNFTGNDTEHVWGSQGTKVKVLEYNETVEIVFQGTGLVDGSGNHPMHFHGYSFYVVGSGYGNFDNETDPSSYNLVDPPLVNTFGVPKLGWLAIRFRANNPGVWFWHCHFDRHMVWGMDTAFIVKDGGTEETSLRPPPLYMPSCLNLTISMDGIGQSALFKTD